MSREETQRLGRLMSMSFGLLQIIAKTGWLIVLIIPFLSAITYDKHYRRDFFIPITAGGEIQFDIQDVDARIKLRQTANKKGSIFTIDIVVQKTKYNWALGIA